MIREVTIYETSDGSQFDTRNEAEEYEMLCEKCEKIMSQLHPHEDNSAVQQDVELVKKAYKEFMELCAETMPSFKDIFLKTADGIAHPSHAERIIGDYDFKCLCDADFRFICTNMVSGIEYEQPYFVEHESEWKKVIY